MNEVYLSNRSAAHCAAGDYEAALRDAKRCLVLKPDWSKGHQRAGAAHLGREDYADAVASYGRAVELDPQDLGAQGALKKAERALAKHERDGGGVRFRAGNRGGAAARPDAPGGALVRADKAVKNTTLLSFGDDE